MDHRKQAVIQVQDLKKSYGDITAVDNISFSICKGQITAILGPNGAGKSTVLGILSTAQSFDFGHVKIGGYDVRKQRGRIRKIIGVVFQNGVLDQRLTVEENLRLRGSFYGLTGRKLEGRILDVTGMTKIEDLLDRYYGTLSGGQKRRCDIARALIHSPQILFLDEPTAGLDPQIRNTIGQVIDNIRKAKGVTVVMTTHYMDEAAMSDNMIIMKKGQIIHEGAPVETEKYFQLIKGEWRL